MRKIKWNWGTKIALIFVGFVGLILFMVFRSFQHNFDLEAEDYYARELAFQEAIDKKARAKELNEDVSWKIEGSQVVFYYPANMETSGIKGRIEFNRPSDKQLDRQTPVASNNDHQQYLALDQFTSGKYKVKVDWSYQGETYLTEGTLFVP